MDVMLLKAEFCMLDIRLCDNRRLESELCDAKKKHYSKKTPIKQDT